MLYIGIRQIEYVLAIARHGGITLAANAIGVSQPAVSVALAKIEDAVGEPLFVRSKGKAAVLTTAGRAFVARAESIVQQMKTLLLPRFGGEVTIGCFNDLAPLLVGPLLGRLQNRDQTIVANVTSGGFSWLSSQTYQGSVDFSITYDLGFDNNFRRTVIAETPPHLLLSPTHRLAQKKRVRLSDLQSEKLILVDQARSIEHVLAMFRQFALTVSDVQRAESFDVMRSMVANNLGVSISYTRSRSNVSPDGKPLLFRDIVDRTLSEPIVILEHVSRELSTSAQFVADEITDLARTVFDVRA